MVGWMGTLFILTCIFYPMYWVCKKIWFVLSGKSKKYRELKEKHDETYAVWSEKLHLLSEAEREYEEAEERWRKELSLPTEEWEKDSYEKMNIAEEKLKKAEKEVQETEKVNKIAAKEFYDFVDKYIKKSEE